MSWDPERYRRFEEERNRPAADLIHGIGKGPFRRIVDLGCGPGNSTEQLVRAYPLAAVSGVDSDAAMVEAARRRLPDHRFDEADILDFASPSGTHLLFANAVFQWIPDHLPLLARLLAGLASGGVLAVQMPDNLDEPTNRLMNETALEGPWKTAFAEGLPRRAPLPPPPAYVEALGAGGAEVTVWRTTYFHRLPDAEAVVDFVGGAGLRPYQQAVQARAGDAAHAEWLNAYKAAVAKAYPPLADGSILMPMPRLFVIARRTD